MASRATPVAGALWREAQRRARDRYWPDVDRLFGDLPTRLYLQATPLRYDLALRWSDTGHFDDILTEAKHFPLLSLATWLLDDLGVDEGLERDVAERRLFLAGVLWLASAHVLDGIHDEASFYDRKHLALARLLSELATAQLAPIVPPTFWDEHGSRLRHQLEDELRLAEPASVDEAGADEPASVGPWAAPGGAIAIAAACHAGRQDAVPRVVVMVDSLARVAQIHSDLTTLHTDLERGRITYPIAAVASAAGVELRRPLPVMELLGAMVATGALGGILDHASEQLDVCRGVAADLRLPTVASYLADVDHMLHDIRSSLQGGGAGRSASARRAGAVPLFLRHEAALPKALDMAERYLLADPTFAESWEVHREGLFGVPEVASRFPAGLILEILCANGRVLSSRIDDFVAAAAADDFRYYTHPDCDMDSDTLGVVLRLLPHARAAEGVLPTIQRALRCVDSIIEKTGRVPVWVTGCEDRTAAVPLLRLGEGCATVEAHFLLGLTGFAFETHRATIARAAAHLLDRVTTVGLGANVNYPPLYALGMLLRLTASLSARSVPPDLRTRLAEGRAALVDRLERSSAMAALSPQDAALLISACFHANEPDLLRPRWVDIVLKAQRSDGRWSAEPFVPSPSRGRSVTWYASTTLTTALCYDALAKRARSAPATRTDPSARSVA